MVESYYITLLFLVFGFLSCERECSKQRCKLAREDGNITVGSKYESKMPCEMEVFIEEVTKLTQ